MKDEIHDCMRHIIICLLDRVFSTCAVPPDLRASIENQVEEELDYSLYGGPDESN